MTKIKNTKKGMAKKTLSISLAVAMLATSNVPVWAAEFTDGTEAAFTSEVEAPVVEEAPVAEVEAPVVDDAEAEAAEDTSISNPKLDMKLVERSWANPITVSGNVISKDGAVVKSFAWEWVVDGHTGSREGVDFGRTTDGTVPAYQPESGNIGDSVKLVISNYGSWEDPVIGNDDWVAETAPVTVTKADVEEHADPDFTGDYKNWVFRYQELVTTPIGTTYKDIDHTLVYNGKNQKLTNFTAPTLLTMITFENSDANLDNDDFDFSCELVSGNGTDAGSVFMIKGTPKRTDLYDGVIRYDYKIEKKQAANEDFSFAINKKYEYTGKRIIPEVSDIKVVDKLSGATLNSEEVIKSVDSTTADPSNIGTNLHSAIVELNNVPNYKEDNLKGWKFSSNAPSNQKGLLYSVVKRDLSNVDIVIDDIAYTGDGLIAKNDNRFDGKVHFFDKTTGEELELEFKQDYDVIVTAYPTEGTKKYTLTIQAPENSTNTTGSKAVDFVLGDHTFAAMGWELTPESKKYLEESVDYTGKVAVKDASKVVYKNKHTGDFLSREDYKVEVVGTDAGKAKVVVTGLRSYTECVETYYFTIKPLSVNATVQKKVVFNKGYTDAAQYAPKVNVAVTTPGSTVTVPAEAYKVTYNFESTNIVGGHVLAKVQILDKNFQGGTTVFYKLPTLIARRDLSACTIDTEKDSYVYTGGIIKPNLIVMDGDEPLTEGVDYVVDKYENAVNVGTGSVIIKGTGDNNTDIDNGIYDKDTTLKVDFAITPANAADVKVEWAAGNTGVQYTGNVIKPTIHKITLNGNDVSLQFNAIYPETNINVGKGKCILKPVDGNKNFTGQKDAEFTISPRELVGELKVYDEKGREYEVDANGYLYDTAKKKYVEFAYDGTEHTFETKFTPKGAYAKYVTDNDYEVIYIDNKYGKVIGSEFVEENGQGRARVAVIGKGNFIGSEPVEDASGNIIKVVPGTAHSFVIKKYEIMKQHVAIADGEYAAGQPVRPNVTVTVGGKTLVENVDYKLLYTGISDLTNGKTMNVSVEGINGYKGVVTGKWGVVKRNMENTQIVLSEGRRPSVTVYNSGVKVPESEYTVAYEADFVVVTAKEDSKYYTGSANAEYITEDPSTKPATPVITNVNVNGNKATAVLAGDSEGAVGYDYVISPNRNCIVDKDYTKVNKNKLTTDTTFTYTQQGTYYAYCHAWKRDENGKKIFSDWSNGFPFMVTSITPDQPVITGVKVSGSTVTVTYTEAANATGYDVVLGSTMATVANEKRPVNYGTLVKKNIKGNTVTATFKDVPAGTYYAGLHAFNRTSEDGKKVFSPWSNAKKVTVK